MRFYFLIFFEIFKKIKIILFKATTFVMAKLEERLVNEKH